MILKYQNLKKDRYHFQFLNAYRTYLSQAIIVIDNQKYHWRMKKAPLSLTYSDRNKFYFIIFPVIGEFYPKDYKWIPYSVPENCLFECTINLYESLLHNTSHCNFFTLHWFTYCLHFILYFVQINYKRFNHSKKFCKWIQVTVFFLQIIITFTWHRGNRQETFSLLYAKINKYFNGVLTFRNWFITPSFVN